MSGRVLIADGDRDRGQKLAKTLDARGLSCTITTHGAAALESALASVPDVVVAEVDLALIDGRKLAAILQANPRTCRTRVVFVGQGGFRDPDAVVSPEDPDAIVRRVQSVVAQRDPGAAPESEPGEGGAVEGQLSQLPLSDLLQLFHVSLKTGIVELSRAVAEGKSEAGRVFLRGGDVVQAVAGAVEGEKALFRLLSWKRGSFSFRPTPVATAARIQTPTRALLREGLRQIAEWKRSAAELPPLDGRLHLRVPRSELPSVIHPVTQEVLLVLDVYSHVRDVLEHTTFPDYQVLRALHTLISRGVVELRRAGESQELRSPVHIFSEAQSARLGEWLDREGHPPAALRNATVLVLASDTEGARGFARSLGRIPGFEPSPRSEAPGPEDLMVLGRLAVDATTGIEFVHVPAGDAFAPFWPVAGYGALASLLLLSGPVTEAARTLQAVTADLRRIPRARLFHLLLLDKGERVSPDDLRENLSLLDEGSLFLVPLEPGREQDSLLREMFSRVVP